MPTTVPTVINSNGVRVPAVRFPDTVFETYLSGTDYVCLTDDDLHTYPPPSSPTSSITSVLSSPLTVAEEFFGNHIQLPENYSQGLAEIPFTLARSHDSGGVGGLRWHTLNPSSGQWVWDNADGWIGAMEAGGKEIMMLLGFTPDWAAASTPSTGKYDNGTTVRASNQPPSDMAYWEEYCSQVAMRYAGRVQYYEIWNEVNYTSYWSGTAAQLAEMHRIAWQTIKAIDPAAQIVGPVVQEPETGGTGNAYLQSFLAASDGATGTGKDWIDICGIHMYPPRYNFQIHANQIANVQASLTAAGVGSLDIWNTETGVLTARSVRDVVQSKWLKRSLLLAAALGVKRYCWYAYDNDEMGMTQSDINAWKDVRDALLSGTMTGCNIAPDGRVAATIAGVNYIY